MKAALIVLIFPFVVRAQTAFPSLRIPASSRGLAMGGVGIASATENQQLYYNQAKSAFTQNFHQLSISYSPWLAAINPEAKFMNVNYLGAVSNTAGLGVSLGYLDIGTMETRDNNGATLGTYHAREFNLGGSLGLQISANASLGVGLRLLGQNAFTDVPRNVYSMCGDISYYQYMNLGDVNKRIEWGAVLSNLGPKISVPGSDGKTSLPTNIGLGVGYVSVDGDDGTQIAVSVDLNKPIVPVVTASISDMRLNAGVEVGFVNSFFLRGGVSVENVNYGNRKFIGLGVGYKGLVLDQSWGIDFHYLVPFGTVAAVSPFQNAFGFSIHLSFGNFQ